MINYFKIEWCLKISKKLTNFFFKISALACKKRSNQKRSVRESKKKILRLAKYRVFQMYLTYFEDLGGKLKTTFGSKWKYLCISELWAFEFHQPFFLSNIGWSQQPPTEIALKFNVIFTDSVNFFSQNIKIKSSDYWIQEPWSLLRPEKWFSRP